MNLKDNKAEVNVQPITAALIVYMWPIRDVIKNTENMEHFL